MEILWQNVRFGYRMLIKKPGFTAIAVITLMLGIGANVAMFSVLNGVLLRPLPFPESDRLVQIHTQWNDFGLGSVNPLEFFDLQDRTSSFQSLGIYRWTSVNLSEGDGDVEQVTGVRASASLFDVLGVAPALGRRLLPGETFAGHAHVVLVSDRLWKRRFGADPGLIGRNLHILNDSYQVVGIMGPGFVFPSREVDLWIGYGIDRENMGNRGSHSSAILARMKPGMTLERAQVDMDTLSAQLRRDYPGTYPEATGFHFLGESYRETLTGDVRPALILLMGAVGFVLLIACANIASLLLARISSREKEIAIRSALGASRGRIIGQILTESFLLCIGGGAGAVLVALLAYRGLVWLSPEAVPRLSEVQLDSRVWVFSLFLIVFVSLAVGLVPALQIAGKKTEQRLREGGRQGSAGGRLRTRAILVIGEVALATVLLIGAGLLIRTFLKLVAVDPGFQPEHVLTAQITLPFERKYSEDEGRTAFFQKLIEEIEVRPGISSAALVSLLPMDRNNSDNAISAEGYVPANPDVPDFIQSRVASPGYFKTMGIPLEKGRSFTPQDRSGSERVIILSHSLARKFWGRENPIGRRVHEGTVDSKSPWMKVIGVVGDVDHDGVRDGAVPMFYRPLYQLSWSVMSLAVRTVNEPEKAENLVWAALKEVDPGIPLYNVRLSREMVAESMLQERFNAAILMCFAGVSLLLAAIGIFGVISYSVGQRTREIGVRMALGAARLQVLYQMLREGLLLVLTGLVLGLVSSLLLTRFLRRMLFGIEPTDPLTYLTISGLLLLTGVVACWGPASRATRIDPIDALRQS